MSDSRRAVVFGDAAVTYDRARPTYPPEAIDHIRGLVDAKDVLEVGAGTGIATALMASPGARIVCIEPSQGMAAVLRDRDLPGVEVVGGTYEDYAAAPDSFDLIFAAQAWHWVDRETGYVKASQLLRSGGALALMWNIPLNRYAEYGDVYRRHAPQLLVESDERIGRRDSHDWREDMAQAGFVDLRLFTHRWESHLSPSGFRELYSTYSDHMMLPEPTRTDLLDSLAGAVAERGGVAVVEYETHVFSGRP